MSEDKHSMILLDAIVAMAGIVSAYIIGEMIGRMIERKRSARGNTIAMEAEQYLSNQER